MSFTIITKPTCIHCTNAKNLLKTNAIDFTEIQVGTDIPVEEIKSRYPEAKMLPIVLEGDTYIGGYDQLKKRIESSL